jgi:polyisoprenoid-binding protein YceI
MASLFGILSMHGIRKQIRFKIEITNIIGGRADHEQEIVVVGHANIRRSDFGMDNLSGFVSDNVELCMQVSALRFQEQM